MTLSHHPVADRPREKLLARGAGSLTDAELIAIFLRTGLPGNSALQIGQQLLGRFNGLRGLAGTSASDLCRVPGLGPAKAAQILAALEMSRRVLEQSMRDQDPLTHPDHARRYISSQLAHRRQEVFGCLFLDTRHRVIRFDELFQGTLDGAPVYPREVVRRAIEVGCAAVILAHNHPSGDPEPSGADIAVTQRLKQALGLIDVRVLDHLIVGHGKVVSLAERGQI